MSSENTNRIIVAGSRDITDKGAVTGPLYQFTAGGGWSGVELVTGGARGVDSLAEEFAEERGIENTVFEAEWDKYGNAAGPIRNDKMAQYADSLVAVWDGESSGTRDMIDKALEAGLDVYVSQVGGSDE